MKFERAVEDCIDLAQAMVIEQLPQTAKFHILWYKPTDANGRTKFLGGRLLLPSDLQRVDHVTARRILWTDGKIPEWINFSVESISNEYTLIEVMLSDKLTSDEEPLRHSREGNPPFHVLGPILPPGWRSVEQDGKFSLFRANWKK